MTSTFVSDIGAATATSLVAAGTITASSFIGAVTGSVVSEATGLLTGGVLSTGTAATEYSITDGTGQVIAADGTATPVSWTGKTNITPVALLTANISFVGITSAGAVIESTAPFTNLELRTIIQLGVAVHVNRTTVDAVNNEQHISYNTNCQLNDLTDAIGFFNVSGNVVSPNGANLNIDKSAGVMYGVGVNYAVDVNNPNALTLALLTAASFQYRFSDGSNGVTGTAVDPDNIDDGAGGLTALANNQWSIQRAYSFTSNNLKLQRGQVSYGSKDLAIAGITSGSFVTEPSIAANGLLRGFLVIIEGATDLSDSAESVFIEATRFQSAAGGVGSTASTLQEVYDNSAANPEILTNATQGAFTLRRGSAADTDDIYQGQNNAATTTFAVTGNGLVTSTALDFDSSTAGIIGTTTNNDADAGSVGQVISNTVLIGSAVSLTTATPANVTSISLTAGDWNVWGNVFFLPAATTNATLLYSTLGSTTANLGAAQLQNRINYGTGGLVLGADGATGIAPMQRISISGTTTYYLVARGDFTVDTLSAFGEIYARRVR
tara:strand:+ start:10876 stop:12528 length:1653 start_codon:yes stop_codon:yes gene_type:complete